MLLHQITPVLSRSGRRPKISESPSKASVCHLLFQAYPFCSAFLSQPRPFVAASGLHWLLPCFPTHAPFIAFPDPHPPPPRLWYSSGDSSGLSRVIKPGGAQGHRFGVQPSSWRPEGWLPVWGTPHSTVSPHLWVFNLNTNGFK